MRLTFYGGTKIVTGANYLLDSGKAKAVVDCGLFQGSKFAESMNYEPFIYKPNELDFVFLTHGHADHVGRLPKLYKEGFRGKVFTTKATVDVIRATLPDSMGLIKDEAKRDGHEPLFNGDDLTSILSLMEGVDYGQTLDLAGFGKVTFHDAGHILGSAIIEIEFKNKDKTSSKIYFSGDLGNPPSPLLKLTYFPKDADYIVVESAYGGRVHEDKNIRKGLLEKIIEETVARGGTLIIPTFAIERTQELLYELNELIEQGHIPKVPVFLDSPLAIDLTNIYKRYMDHFNKDVESAMESGDDIFHFTGLKFTKTSEESRKINDVKGPKIIMAGSGMSNGGRILYHEQTFLPDPKSTVLFVSYQVEGSLGRKLLNGEKKVKILGRMVPVNCKIKAIGGYSGHADQNTLLKWIKVASEGAKLKKVFVVQGEETSSNSLAGKVRDEIAIEAIVPSSGDSFEL